MDSAVSVPDKPKKAPNAGVLAARAANAARKAAGLPIGRPRGSPNKLTQHVRDAVLRAYDEIGGHEAFATWARKHRTQFYGLMVKLAPKEREVNSLGTGIVINVGSASDMRPVIEVQGADLDPE
jgi:hypothetical protein